ncbi:MAG: hypothetical protein ACRDPY_01840 [Streptosporangiaceae bacterium]
MTATFGDFAGAVSTHLGASATCLDHGLGDEPAAAAARQASRLAVTLSHYLADIAPYDEVEALASGRISGWEQAAVDARGALQIAAASLRPAADGPAWPDVAEPAGTLAAHLGAAAMSLAAGRDLLRTHFSTGIDGPGTSEWSAVVTSVPVTRALLDELARWSEQLALLAGRLSVVPAEGATRPVFMPQGMAGACHWLLVTAAALQAGTHGSPLDAEDTELLMAVPANLVAARFPPVGPEALPELCAGVEASASRLQALTYRAAGQAGWSPAMTADSWRWMANGAAVTCHLSEQMLRRLADRTREEDPPGAGIQLGAAVEAMERATARWRGVVAAWDQMTTETTGLTGPGIADMGDLVVRAGRLVSGDPEWVPDRARPSPPREASSLALDMAQVKMITGAIHHVAEALSRLAAADLEAVGMAARAGRLYVPTRTLPDGYDVPYRYGNATPADVRDVLNAYRRAADTAGQAMTALDSVAVTLKTPSRVLVAARAAPHREMAQGADHETRGQGLASAAELPQARARAPGPVEHTLHKLGITDSIPLLRAMAIDKAAGNLTAWARAAVHERSQPRSTPAAGQLPPPTRPARVAAENFPRVPVMPADVDQMADSPGVQRSVSGSLSPSRRPEAGLGQRRH